MYLGRVKTSKDIGQRIKDRRRELKMSQEALSEYIGVTYQQIQRYENGTNRVNIEYLQLLTMALKVPFSYFFEDKLKNATEKHPNYLPEDEYRLLRIYRKIEKDDYKKMIYQITKLAAEHSKST